MYLQHLIYKKIMASLLISLYQQVFFIDKQDIMDLVIKINLSAY